jgi:organic radical activating enzyme
VRKIRLTGGEPLIRHGIMQLVEHLGALPGLDELVLTAMARSCRDWPPRCVTPACGVSTSASTACVPAASGN